MANRPAVYSGPALAVALALTMTACARSDQITQLAAQPVSATVEDEPVTSEGLAPCPLELKDSKATTSREVDISGKTGPGLTVTVVAPKPELVYVEADGSFTYRASGYPKGTTPDAVVVRVTGPSCAAVERGVDIVRRSPSPTTTTTSAPKTGLKSPSDPWCDILGRPAPEADCSDAGAEAEARFEDSITQECAGTPDPAACYREKAHMSD